MTEERPDRGTLARFQVARAVAQVARTRFRRAGLRIGTSSVVHRTRYVQRDDGLDTPAPGCHQGYSPESWERLHPTDAPVTCRKCLTLPAEGDRLEPPPNKNQLPLELGWESNE